MFEPFQNMLPRAANRYGMTKIVQAAEVCHGFRKLLPEFFPQHPEAIDNIDPAFFKQGTLVVNTKTSAWAQEVVMRKPKIIAEMNAKLGSAIIKNLRTKIF